MESILFICRKQFDNSNNLFLSIQKVWSLSNKNKNYIEFKTLKDLLNEIPQDIKIEVILGEPLFINN